MAVKKSQPRTRACPSSQKFIQQKSKNKQLEKQVISVNEKDKNKKACVIAQEIKFARLLSSKDKVTRDRVLKNLRKWLTVRSQSSFAFTESDFTRLWKGLFYCMWMSDKPLIQEELAESLSKIVHCFKNKDVVLLYTACALKTLGIEWLGIDQFRLDKFCMLVRRIIRQSFQKCKENMWNIEWMKGISKILEEILVESKIYLGFKMHVTEVFLEELAKISGGDLPEDVITELIKPFVIFLVPMDDESQIKFVMKHIFRYLIFQSDVGMDYMEKFRAWKSAGFPAGSIDAMEKIELSDTEMDDNDVTEFEEENFRKSENDTEKPLDPRAGRVNVDLPQIPFNAEEIVTLLAQYKFHPLSTTRSRRQLRCLIKEFNEVSKGKMPLGMKEVTIPDVSKKDTDSKLAAIRLLKFEKELHSDNPKKRRKKKKSNQSIQSKDDKSSEEELDNIDSKNSDEDDIMEADVSKITKKKKLKHKLDDIDSKNSDEDDIMEADVSKITKKKKLKRKLNDIDSKNSDEDDIMEADVSKIMRKKKLKRKLDDIDNFMESQSQALSENVKLKKKKFKTEESQISYETNEKKNNCKLERTLNLPKLIKTTNKNKLKRNKNSTVKMLSLTPIKKKNLAKLKVTGNLSVSNNTNQTISSSLDNKDVVSNTKVVENDHGVKDTLFNNSTTWLIPALKKLENNVNKVPSSKGQRKTTGGINSKKRVKISLQRNTAHNTSEYISQLRKNPAIPFDANKKPLAGVLKASPIQSPINPFYRRKKMKYI